MTEYRTLLSNFIKKSTTVGLLRNDGTVDTTDYVSTSNTEGLIKNDGTIDSSDYVEKSSTVGLLKNDGTIDTTEYLTGNEEVIFVNGTNQATDTTTNTFTGTTSKLDSISSVVDGTKLVYKVSVTSTNDTDDLRLSLGTGGSGTIERYIKSGNSYTTANLYPKYTLLFLVYFNVAWQIVGQSNPNMNSNLVDLIYPVGSIYMCVNSTSPATLFGGTWERLKDTFLLASGDTYSADPSNVNTAQHGSATVTLTSAQSGVPAHSHKYQDYNTTYTLKTTNRKPGTSTAVAYGTSLTAGGGATERTSSNNTTANASQAHENMPPYLSVYMWKRTG